MPKGDNDPACGDRVALLRDSPLVTDPYTDRPRDYNTRRLNYLYVTDQQGMRQTVDELTRADPRFLALDIETTGTFKPWMGTVRLIQIGIEEPTPRQFVVDCWRVRPDAIFPLLTDSRRELVTCNGSYEQEHLMYHFGLSLLNVFDVCYSSKAINRALYGRRRIDNSYRGMMRRIVGKKIAKTQQASSWDRPDLSWAQIKYAAQDVTGQLDIRRWAKAALSGLDLTAEAAESTDTRLRRARERVELFGDRRHDQTDRMLRGLKLVRDLQELDRLDAIQAQLTLPHDVRARMHAEIDIVRSQLTV